MSRRGQFVAHFAACDAGDGSPHVLESNIGPEANDEDRYRSVTSRGGIRCRPGLRPRGADGEQSGAGGVPGWLQNPCGDGVTRDASRPLTVTRSRKSANTNILKKKSDTSQTSTSNTR